MHQKQALSLAAGLALIGCAHSGPPDPTPEVRSYAELDRFVGQRVRMTGYVSLTHEASGIYFNRSDLSRPNNRCLAPPSLQGLTHGARMSFSGKLVRTQCGSEVICLNICDNYRLEP